MGWGEEGKARREERRQGKEAVGELFGNLDLTGGGISSGLAFFLPALFSKKKESFSWYRLSCLFPDWVRLALFSQSPSLLLGFLTFPLFCSCCCSLKNSHTHSYTSTHTHTYYLFVQWMVLFLPKLSFRGSPESPAPPRHTQVIHTCLLVHTERPTWTNDNLIDPNVFFSCHRNSGQNDSSFDPLCFSLWCHCFFLLTWPNSQVAQIPQCTASPESQRDSETWYSSEQQLCEWVTQRWGLSFSSVLIQ